MIHASAPGKLMIAGEWAVLESGNICIVAAINRPCHAQIKESDQIILLLDHLNNQEIKGEYKNGHLLLDKYQQKTIFIRSAIETTYQYLGSKKPFKLKTFGEDLRINNKKIGFGSSAASIVAIITALLEFNEYDVNKKLIYKLASLAHYFAQGKSGSGFDIAASTFGGVLSYQRFDPQWLDQQIKRGLTIQDVVDKDWDKLMIKNLVIPQDLHLLVAWTKKSASTRMMIKKVIKTDQYVSINNLVKNLIYAWENVDRVTIFDLIRKNEEYLRQLGEANSLVIETKELKQLAELANLAGGAGKLSGAGGGDCGIALCFDQTTAARIKGAWQQHGYPVLDVKIAQEGVTLINN